ncbi:hypothetical protein [Rhodopseudomonas pseudopalustris]|uniref:Uncharacterized protein n=2 Tax=Rhodopseudomonas TaxID=1073 RepID=Q134N3_RHOPS|nr:hypothetical protein [Rhodopseudomonas pseudopalustris]ABE40456.1 conserved hypothetical protein [Rhodopseudomonas palustris BisB5]SEO48097.1 hypothetical protein SAMN05444123_10317 [Rhodopseudomonas pseudopalustris]
MRRVISGLVAAMAVVTVSAAPALACGGGLFAGACAPCGAVSACGSAAYLPYQYGYGHGYGSAAFERLPDPTRYYYVNHGPTYSGPGNFAPAPYYDDRTVSVWRSGSAYTGGVYADAMTHQYVGAPAVSGPVVYSYGRRHVRHHHRYGIQHGAMYHGHYGAPRYAHAPRYHRHHAPLRRYY